jgi:hypothetical protein
MSASLKMRGALKMTRDFFAIAQKARRTYHSASFTEQRKVPGGTGRK